MNQRFALCCLLLASLSTGCSSLHSREDAKPVAPAPVLQPQAPASATATRESASTSPAGLDSSLAAHTLKAPGGTATSGQTANADAVSLGRRNVYFDYDQSTIHSDDLALLTAHARFLKLHPQAHVRLAGNTDERGTAEYNMALGERRAKAVLAFLKIQGVGAAQLEVVSFGKEKPVDPGHTEAAWAKNRRVELNYLSEAP